MTRSSSSRAAGQRAERPRTLLAGAALAALLLAPPLAAAAPDIPTVAPLPWGEDGHMMAARAATVGLPSQLPAFFRGADAQLAYLNPEPDRWRVREYGEMDQAFGYDHYVDVENVPTAARQARNRYEYLAILFKETELERPERDAGLLPFHIMELYQRLATEWTLWHLGDSPRERAYIEARILNDAGTLGHYVTDASQPHHTTIHFNGWNASSSMSEPNPGGFTESRDFHGRFESAFVSAHVPGSRVRAAAARPARNLGDMEDVRQAVWQHIFRSHDRVEELYRLERDFGFDPEAAAAPETVAFAVERLADGAAMLRDLWWTAYVEGRTRAAALERAAAGETGTPEGADR